MRFTSLLVLAIAGFANTTPIQNRQDGFSIEQVEVGLQVRNGPADVVRTMQKYGQDAPAHIHAAGVKRAAAVGSVTATPVDSYDTAYACPVVVGNDTLRLVFDTGSSDL